MSRICAERMTARIDGELVVFLIGMRINRLWKVHKWLPVFLGMPKMLKELGGATLIGPMLVGLTHSVQICPLGAKDSDIVNMAALAAYDING